MHACMYACMYVCMHVCICVCLYIRTLCREARARTHTHTHTHTYTQVNLERIEAIGEWLEDQDIASSNLFAAGACVFLSLSLSLSSLSLSLSSRSLSCSLSSLPLSHCSLSLSLSLYRLALSACIYAHAHKDGKEDKKALTLPTGRRYHLSLSLSTHTRIPTHSLSPHTHRRQERNETAHSLARADNHARAHGRPHRVPSTLVTINSNTIQLNLTSNQTQSRANSFTSSHRVPSSLTNMSQTITS